MPAGPGAASDSPRPAHTPRCRHCRKRAARTGRNGSRGLCNTCYADVDVREFYPRGEKSRRSLGPCRNCATRKGSRPRGLCYTCYQDGAIRAQHKGAIGHGIEGQRVRPGKRLPAEPTTALPGSEEKIRVLEARAARGEQLHHPQDAKIAFSESAALIESLAGVEARNLQARDPHPYPVSVND